jgi:hypothetical protein
MMETWRILVHFVQFLEVQIVLFQMDANATTLELELQPVVEATFHKICKLTEKALVSAAMPATTFVSLATMFHSKWRVLAVQILVRNQVRLLCGKQ